MLFSSSHGFVESSSHSFVDTLLARTQAATTVTCHEPLPPLSLFDNTPPPSYPYIKTPSSYSAVIQLYARSGQLDSSHLLSARLKDGYQPWCRFGCHHFEDPHHIFVVCPKFTSLRESYSMRIQDATRTLLHTYGSLSEHDISFITERVSSLFCDSDAWPSRRTGYYLGLLPRLVPPSYLGSVMHSRLAHHSHTIAVQLAGRIWGLVRQASRNHSNRQQKVRTTISLPHHLSALFHTRSYGRLPFLYCLIFLIPECCFTS